MARVTVVRSDIPRVYVNDLENRSQRNAPYEAAGQTQYLGSIAQGLDNGRYEALQDFLLNGIAAGAASETVADLLAGTVDSSDVSTGTIQSTISSRTLTAAELETCQDLLSARFVETGPFLLSFDRGVLEGLLDANFEYLGTAGAAIEVFEDDGSTPFAL